MNKHLSDGQIENYISRTLPPNELLETDDHLAACEICMQKVKAQSPTGVLRRALTADTGDGHLTYEDIAGFVDDSLSDADREIVEVHRSVCDECSSEITNMRNIHEALETQGHETARPVEQEKISWLGQLLANRYLRIALPAVGVLILAAIIWIFQKPVDQPIAEVIVPTQTTPLSIENQRPETDNEANSSTEDEKLVASLNDAGGKIGLDENGKVIGVLAAGFDQKIRLALKDQTVEIPSDIRGLRSSSGVLMGNSEDGIPFTIIGPIGKAVESQRPAFSWQLLKDAQSYRVGIYDENFNEVAKSPELRDTRWTPANALKRGLIYQWQVTAIRNGEEVKSPVRPAPEAKFKVVDQASFNAIERVRHSAGNSHLLLGIAFANAGLVDDAEREFQALVKNNPNSEIARKLLSKVKASR